MIKPVRTVAPSATPVSVSDVKARLGISGTEEDAILPAFIEAATGHLDGWSGILGRCLVTQTWAFSLDCWPASRRIELPFPDVSSVGITYRDANGETQTIPLGSFEVFEGARGSIVEFLSTVALPTVASRPRSITITLVAGYGDAVAVPEALKSAIILMVSRMRNLSGESAFLRSETVEGVSSQSWSTSDAGDAIDGAVDALVAPYRVVRL